jgi:hypothetical protein
MPCVLISALLLFCLAGAAAVVLPPIHPQAVAKLRFDDNVVRSDIDAAIALMRSSQASIEPELQKRTREDPVSRLYMVRPPLLLKLLHLRLCCRYVRLSYLQ